MRSSEIFAAFAIGALVAAAVDGSASAQTAGQISAFHSQAAGNCPELDWYLVVRENRQVVGMVGWNDMKSVARMSGAIAVNNSFHLNATLIGEPDKTAVVDGKFDRNGWITADIKGPDVDCKIQVPLFKPTVRKAQKA